MNKQGLLSLWGSISGLLVVLVAIHLIFGVYLERGSINEGVQGYLRLYADGGPTGGIRVSAKINVETVANNFYSNTKVYHVTGIKADKEWWSVDELCKISDHIGTDCTVDKNMSAFIEVDRRPEFDYGSSPEYEGV